MPTTGKFWSDDFDMDLLKLFPNIEEALGETASELVWTLGHTTYGRLNHPTVWNTHGAFLWLHAPALERNAHGWVNVHGCVTDAPIVECSWLEWLRDCWAHNFSFILMPSTEKFILPWNEYFQRLMWHIRAWDIEQKEETLEAHVQVWNWLGIVNRRFAVAQNDWCLAHEGERKYQPGAVPTMVTHRSLCPPLQEFRSYSRAEKAAQR